MDNSLPNCRLRSCANCWEGQAPTIDQVESLRLFPPAPVNGRGLSREVEVGGYRLAVGTEIMHSVYWTQRALEVFAGPDCFNPYRWQQINFALAPGTQKNDSYATLSI